MNQSERDELLVRIDQKVVTIEKVLFEKPTYSTIKSMVLNHSKFFWVIITASTAAFIKAFWK